jgi:hypothetical protein
MWSLARVACRGREGAAARKVLFSSSTLKKLLLEDLAQGVEAYQQAAAAPGGRVEVALVRTRLPVCIAPLVLR